MKIIDADENQGLCSAAAAVAVTTGSAPRKPTVHHRNVSSSKHDYEDDDDVTTAYSTSSSCWLACRSYRGNGDDQDEEDNEDDDDSSMQSSSSSCPPTVVSSTCPSSGSLCSGHHAAVADGDGADEGDETPPRRRATTSSSMSSSSFCYSADASADLNDDDDFAKRRHPVVVVAAQRDDGSRCRCSNGRSKEQLRKLSSSPRYAQKKNEVDDDGEKTSCLISELNERAREMLRRERSAEYRIEDYFRRDDDHHDHKHDRTSHETSLAPIDRNCRAKMMEWSLRVLEISFPYVPTSPPRRRQGRQQRSTTNQWPRRKYSEQSIQIVSQAFALVDRLATRHRIHRGSPMERQEYKLTCMVCLHLAAKTCGLFGLYEKESDVEEEDEDDQCYDGQRSPLSWQEDEDNSCCYNLLGNSYSQSSSTLSPLATDASSDSTTHLTRSSSFDEGQTILPTPVPSDHIDRAACPRHVTDSEFSRNVPSDDNNEPAREPMRNARRRRAAATARRPPLLFLSLHGLSALCRDEHPPGRLADAERAVLEGLGWRGLAGENATSTDWCDVLLESMAVRLRGCRGGGRSTGMARALDLLGEVRERALAGVESAMEANLIVAPSLAARTAVKRALDECYHCECDEFERREWRRVTSTYEETIREIVSPCKEEEMDALHRVLKRSGNWDDLCLAHGT